MARRCVSPFVCETAKLEIFNIPIFLSLSCVLSDADVCFTLEGRVGRPGFIPLGLFLVENQSGPYISQAFLSAASRRERH